MRPLTVLHWLFTLRLATAAGCIDTSSLQRLLSPGARIDALKTSQPLRWSEYKAPQPGAIVHVGTEHDVQTTVQWAINHSVPFLVQNGGNGWSTTLNLNSNGILIDLDQLTSVIFNADKTQVTIGGGVLVSGLISAAASRSALVATGTCNCVGALGAALGGGVGYLMGEYGLAVDNIASLNVVTSDGNAITVTSESHSDLFWAMRGAGPNFGVVTSATLISYPVASSALDAWAGPLIFIPSQLGALIAAIQNLQLNAEMALSMTWVSVAGSPTIIVSLFYHGTEAAGKDAFASLYAIGPVADETAVIPFTEWNSGADNVCVKGGQRKPTWGVGLAHMDVTTWESVFTVWQNLTERPEAVNSSMLLNTYATTASKKLPDSSSAYPFRSTVKFFASITAEYEDASFDATALSFGQTARSLWQATDGLSQHSTYINNGFGDESLQTIYGNSLSKLKSLKRLYDPARRFNQWFPLS